MSADRRTEASATLASVDRATAAAILQLEPTASATEVDQAFRHQARALHPDAGGDQSGFERLVHARDILSSGTRTQGSPPLRPDRPLVILHNEPWWRRLLRALRFSDGSTRSRVQ